MKRDHLWRTYHALPHLSFDDCARPGCPARAMQWLKDGHWHMRFTTGPVKCGGEN